MSEMNDHIDDFELEKIMAEYRRQKMVEHMIGPVVATVFHIALFFGLTLFVVWDTEKEKDEEIVVETVVQEQVEIEPEDQPEPEPEEMPEEQEETATEISVDMNSDVPEENFDAVDSDDSELPSLDIKDLKSPLTSAYVSRSRKGLGAAAQKFGGSQATIAAVDRALEWLKKNQNEDGSWGKIFEGEEKAEKRSGKQADTARPMLTGMALLAYLAQGETHLSKKYGKTVKKAIVWLSNRVIKYRFLKGDYGGPYPHCMGTYALCEAVALTDISIAREAMDIAISEMIKRQDKETGMVMGGTPSVILMGWIYQSYTAAIVADTSVQEIHTARDNSLKVLDGLFKTGKIKGKEVCGYVQKSNKIDTIPTYSPVGLLCSQLSGEFGKGNSLKAYDSFKNYAMETAKWEPTGKKNQYAMHRHLYTWYYTTQVFFNKQGSDWRQWNGVFKRLFLSSQLRDGSWQTPNKGEYTYTKISGPQKPAHRESDGRIYATALSSICLTVYYRNLPTLKKSQGKKSAAAKSAESEAEVDDLEIF